MMLRSAFTEKQAATDILESKAANEAASGI
jgi:hypothetical protein